MKRVLFHWGIFILSLVSVSTATAAELCQNVFSDHALLAPTIALAEKMAVKKGVVRGLSVKDVEYLVSGIFQKAQGPSHGLRGYLRLSPEQRTRLALERQLGEKIVNEGVLRFLQENALQVDNSRFRTKVKMILQSRAMKALSTSFAVVTSLYGAPPFFLPTAKILKLKEADMQTLLWQGFESPSGKALLKKYRIDAELDRGYNLFSRYYSRLAVLTVAFLAFDMTMTTLQEQRQTESQNAFDTLMSEFEAMFPSGSEPQTREDILFITVLELFVREYGRTPDTKEQREICKQVYGPGHCPTRGS